MRFRTLLPALLFLLLPSVRAYGGEGLVIVSGKTSTVKVPFPIGSGANSDPTVVSAVVDLESQRIVFEGKSIGTSTYVVFDKRSRAHRLEFEIRVVDAKEEAARESGDAVGRGGGLAGALDEYPGDTAAGAGRERILERVETIRIARMTRDLNIDPSMAEKLFPALRPFSERRAAATAERLETLKGLDEALDAASPDPKKVSALLDRFASAQKELNAVAGEEYEVLKKILDPLTLARYYRFQIEFERDMRQVIKDFREADGTERGGKRERRLRLRD